MALQDALGPNADSIRESSEVSLTREKLYELVWSQPMTKIAAEYKVSSSYLARVCPVSTRWTWYAKL
ncbi:hypothetical protein ABXL43_33945, partial [Burkholderia sola]